jgi:hypothetical protein
MKIIYCYCLLVLLCTTGAAQITETFRVKAGEDLSSILSAHGLYKNAAFINGTVYLKDKSVATAAMNYNIYIGDIQFIDPKGETLSIANPEVIDSVVLGENLYFFKKGYLEVIKNYGTIKLAARTKIEFRPVKLGAYGSQATNVGMESYGHIGNAGPYLNSKEFTANQDLQVIRETSYLLLYKNVKEAAAKRSGFLDAFPKIEKIVTAYIQSQNIDFKKKEDLIKLLAFCVEKNN